MPGEYDITVTSSGFTTYKSKVSITVGAKVGVDVKLGVGEAVTVIEVNEVAAAVKTNTETQTIHPKLLSTTQLNEFPPSRAIHIPWW